MTKKNLSKRILIVKLVFMVINKRSKQGYIIAIFPKQFNLNAKKYH